MTTLKEDFESLKEKTKDVETSFAMEILQDYKLVNKRQFIIIMLLIMGLCCSIIYTVHILNDISTVETVEVQQDNESGNNNYIGNDGAKDDTLKSLEYMLESATDFFHMLKSEANSQEEMQLIREYAKKISEM